jgi:transcriptional regulator with XRE-family HTH domain
MFRKIERYEDVSLGLPYPVVLLNGVEEEIDDVTGKRVGISIPYLEDLIATVAIARILHPLQLDGAEVKFIRRVIGRSAKEFAGNLDIAPETYSRWENGKRPVGDWGDKQVRLAAIAMLWAKVTSVHADPATIVNMRIEPRSGNEVPQMEVSLVHHEHSATHEDGDEWDLKLAA